MNFLDNVYLRHLGGVMTKQLDDLIDSIMKGYQKRVPQLNHLLEKMKEEKLVDSIKDIENDHFAFRTVGLPQLGIESLAPIFTHFGYFRKDFLHFESKKLDAYWFAPPTEKYPRVFISEVKVELLSETAQEIIKKHTHHIKSNPVLDLDLHNIDALIEYFETPQWPLVTLDEYQTLAKESEYASWVMVNQNNLNHFTISIHGLPSGYDTLDNFNQFVEKQGIPLNEAGGKIKTSPDGKLLQSSTTAPLLLHELSDGSHEVPSSYIEFAERKALDEFKDMPKEDLKRQHRREGFEAANANKIFESTYSEQTKK